MVSALKYVKYFPYLNDIKKNAAQIIAIVFFHLDAVS